MNKDDKSPASLISLATQLLRKMQAEEDARIASLPVGTCPECEGTGEQGGQFCGGYWTCEACGGSGMTTKVKEDE